MSLTEYGKHKQFVVRQQEPFNGGPPLELLVEHELTPTELFFARNHGNVPDVDADSFRLRVTGLVERELTLSLNELQNKFEAETLTATLQCAGNRRAEMMAMQPIPGELDWGPDAIGNATWTGARLGDLLRAAGVGRGTDLHVEFIGSDDVERHGAQFNFAGSIPLSKAQSSEVLLAYQMNGQPLEPVHGFPLRTVVPGYIGARSVKWVREIRVQKAPSQNYFQRRAYRLFPPSVSAENVDWDQGQMLGEFLLTSAICRPGAKANGKSEIAGYALAGGGRQVSRVELSSDGGKTWQLAELEDTSMPWAWRIWRSSPRLKAGTHPLVVRAVDTSANEQPEEVKPLWNFKGYMNNAWHRRIVKIER